MEVTDSKAKIDEREARNRRQKRNSVENYIYATHLGRQFRQKFLPNIDFPLLSTSPTNVKTMNPVTDLDLDFKSSPDALRRGDKRNTRKKLIVAEEEDEKYIAQISSSLKNLDEEGDEKYIAHISSSSKNFDEEEDENYIAHISSSLKNSDEEEDEKYIAHMSSSLKNENYIAHISSSLKNSDEEEDEKYIAHMSSSLKNENYIAHISSSLKNSDEEEDEKYIAHMSSSLKNENYIAHISSSLKNSDEEEDEKYITHISSSLKNPDEPLTLETKKISQELSKEIKDAQKAYLLSSHCSTSPRTLRLIGRTDFSTESKQNLVKNQLEKANFEADCRLKESLHEWCETIKKSPEIMNRFRKREKEIAVEDLFQRQTKLNTCSESDEEEEKNDDETGTETESFENENGNNDLLRNEGDIDRVSIKTTPLSMNLLEVAFLPFPLRNETTLSRRLRELRAIRVKSKVGGKSVVEVEREVSQLKDIVKSEFTAAQSIQKAYRGFLARQYFNSMKQERLWTLREYAMIELEKEVTLLRVRSLKNATAATLILQNFARKYVLPQRRVRFNNTYTAVLCIQKVVRGLLARASVPERKKEKKENEKFLKDRLRQLELEWKQREETEKQEEEQEVYLSERIQQLEQRWQNYKENEYSDDDILDELLLEEKKDREAEKLRLEVENRRILSIQQRQGAISLQKIFRGYLARVKVSNTLNQNSRRDNVLTPRSLFYKVSKVQALYRGYSCH
eukprot:g388.t1